MNTTVIMQHKSLTKQLKIEHNKETNTVVNFSKLNSSAENHNSVEKRSSDDLASREAVSKSVKSSEPPIIKAQNAEHLFNEDVGVRDLTFYVPRGVIFGLVGPSGSGKTTTIRLLSGMYKPTSGSVQVLDQAPNHFSSRARENIGYMPQHFVLYPMLSVAENLNFVASLYGMGYFKRRKRSKTLLRFVELDRVRDRLASRLSGGMQRRLQLACALAHDPQLIFADEPTAGVDPVMRSKFWDHFRELRDEGRTLFVTTQYIGEIENCDIVAIIREGRMLYINTPEELRRKAFGGDLIRLSVDPKRVVEAVHLLNNQSIVKDARRSFGQPGLLLVSTDDAASSIPTLIAVLKESKIDTQQAEKYAPPFDDVFIELMKQDGGGDD